MEKIYVIVSKSDFSVGLYGSLKKLHQSHKKLIGKSLSYLYQKVDFTTTDFDNAFCKIVKKEVVRCKQNSKINV